MSRNSKASRITLRTQPAMNKSEEQRVMLIGAALALLMVAIAMAVKLICLAMVPALTAQERPVLPVCDKMLLTPEEREEARRTNVGCYTFDGTYYVNASLPEEYWTEWRSSDG